MGRWLVLAVAPACAACASLSGLTGGGTDGGAEASGDSATASEAATDAPNDVHLPDAPGDSGPAVSIFSIFAGNDETCAIAADNTLRCWGANESGQLGDGTTTDRSRPVIVMIKGAPTAAAVGFGHACAIVGGVANCWGGNVNGELGNGTSDTTAHPIPGRVSGIGPAMLVSVGDGDHVCASAPGPLGQAQVLCWGANVFGQLGNGATAPVQATPVVAQNLSSSSSLAVGQSHSCSVNANTAQCWGLNAFGQLGNGTTTDAHVPTPVQNLTNVASIAAGATHTCAVAGNGSVSCWGSNLYGQIGDGTNVNRPSPQPVLATASGIRAIATGDYHTCAVSGAGQVACWGENDIGQLGTGTTMDRSAPVAVAGVQGATGVAAGSHHTCALLASGNVVCWGDGSRGQLGTGSLNGSLTPVPVVF